MKKRICVVLHLYYTDLIDYFEPYIKNIGEEHDLYVTITKGHYHESIIQYLKDNFNGVNIFVVENKGMDIAPFFFVLNEIQKNGIVYDYIIKLHTKKCAFHDFKMGSRWRKILTESLLATPERLYKNIEFFKNEPNCKMIASSCWTFRKDAEGFEQKFISKEIPEGFVYNYVGGTMFMIDFELIMNWFVSEDIFNKFYNEFPDGYVIDNTIAHQMERFFGCLVYLNGYEIYGV